ncbi:hypothetical protein BXY85_2182 [Roseivirga pacifica]|uniref:Uncharacterized protein n=1 Tax=Roseivirga pacifica TaxID=1267423 RepID=A0A1I0NFN5_9BACT|nr:glycosyltransferase [Roseivirga pacifica]RKQ51160.1 hypothetical protein BXY85_2182 [Roseivirga pacifica]SEW00166.1 hypothetical protein SAMN05216290_1164 [Roseivirga pacifica]
MDAYNGTTLYVKDLALGLVRRGVGVEVFTLRLGKVSREIADAGVVVTTKLAELSRPDLIHGHQNIVTRLALNKFKLTPCISWIHDRLSPLDIPLFHKNIVQYAAVDYNCAERYIQDYSISSADIKVVYNWVNLERFEKKKTWSATLNTALVFSNYANNHNYLKLIKQACEIKGVNLQVIGKGVGKEHPKPEQLIGGFDLVFGKAKAAMESMAVGCAVIVCDFTGLAGMVKPQNFDHYRKYNFGMKLMTRLTTVETLCEELDKFSTRDSQIVCDRIREDASLEKSIDLLINLYQDTILRHKRGLRNKYSASFKHTLLIWKKTIRIWLSIWTELNYPKIYKAVKG